MGWRAGGRHLTPLAHRGAVAAPKGHCFLGISAPGVGVFPVGGERVASPGLTGRGRGFFGGGWLV